MNNNINQPWGNDHCINVVLKMELLSRGSIPQRQFLGTKFPVSGGELQLCASRKLWAACNSWAMVGLQSYALSNWWRTIQNLLRAVSIAELHTPSLPRFMLKVRRRLFPVISTYGVRYSATHVLDWHCVWTRLGLNSEPSISFIAAYLSLE